MALTNIFYYIPEDNEDPNHLNTFTLYKSTNDITLTDIRNHFPLPGDYHFRF